MYNLLFQRMTVWKNQKIRSYYFMKKRLYSLKDGTLLAKYIHIEK